MKKFSLNVSETFISFCHNFDSIFVYELKDNKIDDLPLKMIRIYGVDVERFYLTDAMQMFITHSKKVSRVNLVYGNIDLNASEKMIFNINALDRNFKKGQSPD